MCAHFQQLWCNNIWGKSNVVSLAVEFRFNKTVGSNICVLSDMSCK